MLASIVQRNTALKIVIIATLLVAMSLSLFGSKSFAADTLTASTTATIQVNGGSRTIAAPGTVTLPAVPLGGAQTSTTLDLGVVNVVDASGSGAGWRVDVSAPQVKAGTKTLDKNLLKIDPVVAPVKVDPTSGAVPVVKSSGNIDTGSAVTLVEAAVDTGMGSYSFDQKNLTLTVPANTYAGTYTVVLTYSLVTAP